MAQYNSSDRSNNSATAQNVAQQQAAQQNSRQPKQRAQAIKITDNRPSLSGNPSQLQPSQLKPVKQRNNTGLPDNLKSGMEKLSGMSLDHVNVHYNSAKPAAVQAHAYAQGSDIHLASGQEKHLPHELGHVVQQAQGRVQPTTSVGGMAVNDNYSLENEATVMGDKALQMAAKSASSVTAAPVQRMEEEEELMQGKFTGVQRVEKELMQGKFSGVQRVEEEELMQGKFTGVQRVEEEELMQGKFAGVQRVEEDELMQGKFSGVQRVEEEEELMQGKFAGVQRVEEELMQGKFATISLT